MPKIQSGIFVQCLSFIVCFYTTGIQQQPIIGVEKYRFSPGLDLGGGCTTWFKGLLNMIQKEESLICPMLKHFFCPIPLVSIISMRDLGQHEKWNLKQVQKIMLRCLPCTCEFNKYYDAKRSNY